MLRSAGTIVRWQCGSRVIRPCLQVCWIPHPQLMSHSANLCQLGDQMCADVRLGSMSALPPKADIGTGPYQLRRSNSGSLAMPAAIRRVTTRPSHGASVMPMIRAMATETVVDPAMANWWAPIWPTKHTPNNPARDRTDRTRNHKARTRSSSGTDHVGACGSRDRCDCHDDRESERKVAHLISPPEEILLRQLNAQNMTPGPVASPTVALLAFGSHLMRLTDHNQVNGLAGED